MKLPRPGPDIGEPWQQHMVLAMLVTISMGYPAERAKLAAALARAVKEMWDWDEQRFRDELKACHEVMVEHGGRLTCWFTPEGLEFDFNVPQ